MIGIGIIGGGRICGAHSAALTGLAGTFLAGIAEIDAERRAKAVAPWGCPGHEDYRRMLEDPAVSGVIIALPHHLHAQVTIDCLRAGKAVMLEKPMAMTLAECDAMLAAREESGSLLMVGHTQQFRPINQEARRLIAEGRIGTPIILTDTWYKPFWADPRPAWFLEAATGGGMWAMNGTHMIDRLLLFSGSRIESVKARVGSPVFGLSASDSGAAYLQFESGAAGLISHVGYKEGVERFEAEISGTEGQLRLPGGGEATSGLMVSSGGRWEEVPVPAPAVEWKPNPPAVHLPIAVEVNEFVSAIREGRPPAVTGEYAREIVRVMLACEESSTAGREVHLD